MNGVHSLYNPIHCYLRKSTQAPSKCTRYLTNGLNTRFDLLTGFILVSLDGQFNNKMGKGIDNEKRVQGILDGYACINRIFISCITW